MGVLQANNATVDVKTGKGKASRGAVHQASIVKGIGWVIAGLVCGHAADASAICLQQLPDSDQENDTPMSRR